MTIGRKVGQFVDDELDGVSVHVAPLVLTGCCRLQRSWLVLAQPVGYERRGVF